MNRRNWIGSLGFMVLACAMSAGCQTHSSPNESAYAGGNGAFGESPEQPAAYHVDATYRPVGKESGFAGGNGEFGETPAHAGQY